MYSQNKAIITNLVAIANRAVLGRKVSQYKMMETSEKTVAEIGGIFGTPVKLLTYLSSVIFI